MSEFKKYHRKQAEELRMFVPGEHLSPNISISKFDLRNGSPKEGDMIARNPKSPDDQRLVAKAYFKDNFKEIVDKEK